MTPAVQPFVETVHGAHLPSLPVPPKIMGRKEEELSVIEGHMVSLLCDVQSYPPPEITWTRDGQVLNFDTGLHILPGQNLRAACKRRMISDRNINLFESNKNVDIALQIIVYVTHHRWPDAAAASGETGRRRAIRVHGHQLGRAGPEEHSPQCLR